MTTIRINDHVLVQIPSRPYSKKPGDDFATGIVTRAYHHDGRPSRYSVTFDKPPRNVPKAMTLDEADIWGVADEVAA